MRSPFVVTIVVSAASASSGACSSGSSSDPHSADAVALGDSSSVEAAIDGAGRDASDAPSSAGCPVSDPGFGVVGKACEAAETVRCRYPDLCSEHPVGSNENVYRCTDPGSGKRSWTLVSEPYLPECPLDIPVDGSDCPCALHLGSEVCAYGNCETVRTIAVCHTVDEIQSVWTVVALGCNPPEPDASRDGASEGGDAADGAVTPDADAAGDATFDAKADAAG